MAAAWQRTFPKADANAGVRRKLLNLVPVAIIQASVVFILAELPLAWSSFQPSGYWSDFLAYYTSSRMVLSGLGPHVYDRGLQVITMASITGNDPRRLTTPLYYVNPPQATLLLTPVSMFPYTTAAICWSALMAVALIVAVVLLVRSGGWQGRSALAAGLLVLAVAPAFVEVIRGQLDALVLLGFAGCLVALKHDRSWGAGVALSLVLLKPHVAFLVFPILVLQRHWKLLVGVCVGFLAQVALTSILFGFQSWVQWAAMLTGPALGLDHWGYIQATSYSAYSLGNVIGMPVGLNPVAMVVGSLIAIALVARYLDGTRALVAALGLSVVLAPHAGVQDLVLLAPLAVLYGRDLAMRHGRHLALGAMVLSLLFLAAEFSAAWGWPIPLAVGLVVAHLMRIGAPAAVTTSWA